MKSNCKAYAQGKQKFRKKKKYIIKQRIKAQFKQNIPKIEKLLQEIIRAR